MDIYLFLTFLFGGLMAFSMGANDAANSLGMSYGTKAVSFPIIILIGSIAEFLGGYYFSDRVT